MIGLVHDDPNATTLDQVQRGMVEVCVREGYELVVHPCSYDDPNLEAAVRSFVRRSRVDGVLAIPPVSELKIVDRALATSKTPYVKVASVDLSPSCIISDERTAAANMAQYLLDLGHRSLGIINGPNRFLSACERREGFADELRRRGAPPPLEIEGDYSFESGRACAASLLTMPRRPSAIFAANDSMAAGVLSYAAEIGLNVPRQLSVAGFDDSPIATMLTPNLTTIRRPNQQIAQAATERLISLIVGRLQPRFDRNFSCDLVVRDSTIQP